MTYHSPLPDKLEFLCEHGREDQIGTYVRNQNILNPKFKEEYKLKGFVRELTLT